MIEIYKQQIESQYLAAMKTLNFCIEHCSESGWNQPVGSWNFDQVVFHTLFYTDAYLGPNIAANPQQAFHQKHRDEFAGYEELEDGPPTRNYDRVFIRRFSEHCLQKIPQVIAAETEEQLATQPGFDWLLFSRAEVHVYNIRHIQHHAAQLSLHLRLKDGVEVPWFGVA